MIVVCDTSAICYLLLIGEVDLLPFLFGQISVPQAVHRELTATGAPEIVRVWAANPPGWCRVHSVQPISDLASKDLHEGEVEVLSLAHQLLADLVILDDKAAREIAEMRGLRVTGLLGVLDRAARKQRIDLGSTLVRLQATNFRLSPVFAQKLIRKWKSS